MKAWFLFLCLGLILVNCLTIYFFGGDIDRWFRFGATFIFLLLYLFKYFSRFELLIVFLLLSFCDYFLVSYENPLFRNLVYLCRILAYMTIIGLLAKNLSLLKLNTFSLLIGFFVISIDVYLIYEMAGALPEKDQDPLFIALFYGLGIFSLILVAVCFSNFFRFANKPAFYLLLISFCFVLSDIFYYNAYYLDFESFYYLDRVTNIFGMGTLVWYSREVLNQTSGSKTAEEPKYL